MKRRIITMIFTLMLTALVFYVNFDAYLAADPLIADFYIEHFKPDTYAQNAVAAIYLNYRVFDSIFETLILLVSVTAVINLSWRRTDD
ncbi:hypothetical protein [uncultured Acetobacterium sp.]|uniref:hypothetical protein n=1 Tax=uncultured Acetobacterium sp. TaxID=217139 RepID=UPI0024247B12|nr:hypothetical protein [uncultured Acetobacterium sp.]MBU4540361.1 hypothetical protein [Bacillota bacterium]